VFVTEGNVANRLMRYYKSFTDDHSNKAFGMNDILDVTLHNKGREKNEKRLRWNITKVKHPNTISLIN